MFDTLLELPLFQGLGKSDLTQIMETVQLDVVNYEPGKYIVKQESPCNRLVFLLKGTLTQHTLSDDHSYAFQERVPAPSVLQPEVLYGVHPRYTHSYITQSETQIITVPKAAINQVFMNYEVFRLNFINLLSTLVFRGQRLLWANTANSIEQRIIHFIRRHAQYPAGEKILNITMESLANQLNETRINISKALNRMEQRNLVLLRRKEIIVPALEKLLNQQ